MDVPPPPPAPPRRRPGGVRRFAAVAACAAAALLAACGDRGERADLLRLGHFPNLTHAQALVARHRARGGDAWLDRQLGVTVEWRVYNAGPGAMEALLSGELDATWVGPNPALNAHVRSRGEEVRVVAGATWGGSALVVRAGAGVTSAADLRGKVVATPQLGNTQDVACRDWLLGHGLRAPVAGGGDVDVRPTANPEILSLFLRGDLAAAWTVEPWVSRLETEGAGTLLVDDRESVTTVLVTTRRALEGRRDLVRRLVAANDELSRWIAAHPTEAQAAVRDELAALTRVETSAAVLARAWPRLAFRSDVDRAAFDAFAAAATRTGLMERAPDLSRLVERP